jgi:hypothetical protein
MIESGMGTIGTVGTRETFRVESRRRLNEGEVTLDWMSEVYRSSLEIGRQQAFNFHE